MSIRLKPVAAAICALSCGGVLAQAEEHTKQLDTLYVSADRHTTPIQDTAYAAEVHTRKDIENSGATSLYDYLATHSSLQVMPSYGNRATPKLDMRGYGIGDGHQNIVVMVDGQRLNNVDMSPQLLGAVPLADIERIEIAKGSGSVLYGDGAMAGAIQIHTRQQRGVAGQVAFGSNGFLGTTFSAGAGNEQFGVTASYDHNKDNGASERDVTGKHANNDSEVARLKLSGKLGDRLKLSLDGYTANLDTRYPGSITQAQFDRNPAQNGGNTYTHQTLSSSYVRASGELELTKGLKLHVSRGAEDKESRFVSSGWTSQYFYVNDEVSASFENESLSLRGGYQGFDGNRESSTDKTYKNNSAWFASGQLYLGALTLSGGLRNETVHYEYRPLAGAVLKDDSDLHAWDIGANYRIDERWSVFANLNRSFQAPDIDRFFTWWGAFNAFIKPATAHTFNVGLHHVLPNNQFQATLFRANLKNEIYYNSGTFTNTNIDKSHKYGVEIQDRWLYSNNLSLTGKYAYTRAIVDREADGGGAFNGKDLPGVPRHSVNLGAQWRVTERASLNVSQVWRSKAYAAEDFANNAQQRQRVYASTDLVARYRFEQFEVFAGIENLFDRSNGIWVRDDAIYPVNFKRSWKVGLQARF